MGTCQWGAILCTSSFFNFLASFHTGQTLHTKLDDERRYRYTSSSLSQLSSPWTQGWPRGYLRKVLAYLNTQLTPKSFELDCLWTSPEWCCYWKMTPNILAFGANAKGSETVAIAQKREFRPVFWHRQNVANVMVLKIRYFCCNKSQLLKEELVCKLQTRFSVGKTHHLHYLCLVQHSTSHDS